MAKLRVAVIGAGFVGKVHVENIRRQTDAELVALADQSQEIASAFGEHLGIARAVGDYNELLADPSIDAVHICTPNATHFPIAKAAIEAGKNVICEKPLAMSAGEAQGLVQLAREKGVVHATSYNLRFYPNVAQMRRMVATGAVGDVLAVQGAYSRTGFSTRPITTGVSSPKSGGISRAMADIGSHWCDMVEHVTGRRIQAVCAELMTFHPVRKKPKKAIETYAGKLLQPEDYEDRPIATEDFGAILLRFAGRARGAFTINQVAAGRKNRLVLEVYGRNAAWPGTARSRTSYGSAGAMGTTNCWSKIRRCWKPKRGRSPIFRADTRRATPIPSSSSSGVSMPPAATSRSPARCRLSMRGCVNCDWSKPY